MFPGCAGVDGHVGDEGGDFAGEGREMLGSFGGIDLEVSAAKDLRTEGGGSRAV